MSTRPMGGFLRFSWLLLAGLVGLFLLAQTARASVPGKGLKDLIGHIARQEGLTPKLVEAVVRAESDFNARSVSKKGAVGLMQLMPDTARAMGVSDRFDPEQNLRGGSRYLKQLMDRYQNLRLALAAYNAGPGAVDRHGGVPPYPETRRYIQKIFHFLKDTTVQPPSAPSAPSVVIRASNPAPAKPIFRFRAPNGTLILTDNPALYQKGNQRLATPPPQPSKPRAIVTRSTPAPSRNTVIRPNNEVLPTIRLAAN